MVITKFIFGEMGESLLPPYENFNLRTWTGQAAQEITHAKLLYFKEYVFNGELTISIYL